MAREIKSASPAPYSDVLLDPIAEILKATMVRDGAAGEILLDPFAGLGKKLAVIAGMVGVIPYGVEIEPGYFTLGATHPCVHRGNSKYLQLPDCSVGGAVTSPAYPNGVSDNFASKDGSIRHTYVHYLRHLLRDPDYQLHPDNAGGMNPRRSEAALAKFYELHEAVWAEVFRVLKPGAPFVVNTKDTPKVMFRIDTERQLLAAGFERFDVERQVVMVRGLNHGSNQDTEHKLPFEDLTVVRKPL